MCTLIFDRQSATLTLMSGEGQAVSQPMVAYNNVDSTSRGPWPDGTFPYVDHILHSDLSDPEQAYGLYGILVFLVPGRSGMGVHSGRRDVADGRGRMGPQHATMGCIRTTDEAMLAILTQMKIDPMTTIEVRDQQALLERRIDAAVFARSPPKPGKRRASRSS